MSITNIAAHSRVTIIVPNAVALVQKFFSEQDADRLGAQIVAETHTRWRGQLKFGRGGRRFDHGHTMSRFGDPGVTYSFKGKAKPMYELTPGLCEVREAVASALSWRPNCVVLNTYEPGSGLYPHRDSTYIPQLGKDPAIVAVSFGTARTFELHEWDPVADKYVSPRNVLSIELGHGDMLIMHGRCDSLFKHGIPEQPERSGTRMSLTFRKHLTV